MYQKVESWFNIVALEKDVLKFWEEQQIFQKLVVKKSTRNTLVFYRWADHRQ